MSSPAGSDSKQHSSSSRSDAGTPSSSTGNPKSRLNVRRPSAVSIAVSVDADSSGEVLAAISPRAGKTDSDSATVSQQQGQPASSQAAAVVSGAPSAVATRTSTLSPANTSAERAAAHEQIAKGAAEPPPEHKWRRSSVSQMHGAAIDGMGVAHQVPAGAHGAQAEAHRLARRQLYDAPVRSDELVTSSDSDEFEHTADIQDPITRRRFVRQMLPKRELSHENDQAECLCVDYTPVAVARPVDMQCRLRVVRAARMIRLVISITMYNEGAEELRNTMRGVAENMEQLQQKHGMSWQEILVVVTLDGITKAHESTLLYAEQELKIFQPSLLENSVKGKPTTMHMFERTVELAEDKASRKYFSPMQVAFMLKARNGGKLNSLLWLLRGVCRQVFPKYVLFLDVGTVPRPSAISKLVSTMEQDPFIGGCCGEITVRKYKCYDPLHAAQFFEYKQAHLLDKTFQSFFGYLTVLPGAFSAVRYQAIRGEPLRSFFLTEEQSIAKLGPFVANQYLAEDRILCWEVVAKEGCAWKLTYVEGSVAETDVPDDLPTLIRQRRRWLNGSVFVQFWQLSQLHRIMSSGHSCCQKFVLFMQSMFFFLETIVSWFSVGTLLLSFLVIFFSALVFAPAGEKELELGLPFLYISLLFLQLVLGLAGRLKDLSNVYFIACILWGIAMFLALLAAAFVIGTLEASFFVIVTVIVAQIVYLGAALFHGPYDFLFTLISYPLYLFFLPTFLNSFQIYSWSQLHDVSWGNREGGSIMEMSRQLKTEAKQNIVAAAELNDGLIRMAELTKKQVEKSKKRRHKQRKQDEQRLLQAVAERQAAQVQRAAAGATPHVQDLTHQPGDDVGAAASTSIDAGKGEAGADALVEPAADGGPDVGKGGATSDDHGTPPGPVAKHGLDAGAATVPSDAASNGDVAGHGQGGLPDHHDTMARIKLARKQSVAESVLVKTLDTYLQGSVRHSEKLEHANYVARRAYRRQGSSRALATLADGEYHGNDGRGQMRHRRRHRTMHRKRSESRMRGASRDRSDEPGKVRPAMARKLSKKSSFFQGYSPKDHDSDGSSSSGSYSDVEEGGNIIVDNDDPISGTVRRSETADLRKLLQERGSSALEEVNAPSDSDKGSSDGRGIFRKAKKKTHSSQYRHRGHRRRHGKSGGMDRRQSMVSVALDDMDGAAQAMASLRLDGSVSDGSGFEIGGISVNSSELSSDDDAADRQVQQLANRVTSRSEGHGAGASASAASAGKEDNAVPRRVLKPTRSKQQMQVLSAHQEAKKAAAKRVMAAKLETPQTEVTNRSTIAVSTPVVAGRAPAGDYGGLAASALPSTGATQEMPPLGPPAIGEQTAAMKLKDDDKDVRLSLAMIKKAHKRRKEREERARKAARLAQELHVDKDQVAAEFNNFRLRMVSIWVLSNALLVAIVLFYGWLPEFAAYVAGMIILTGGSKLLFSILFQVHRCCRSSFHACCRPCCYRVDYRVYPNKFVCCCRRGGYYDIDVAWQIELLQHRFIWDPSTNTAWTGLGSSKAHVHHVKNGTMSSPHADEGGEGKQYEIEDRGVMGMDSEPVMQPISAADAAKHQANEAQHASTDAPGANRRAESMPMPAGGSAGAAQPMARSQTQPMHLLRGTPLEPGQVPTMFASPDAGGRPPPSLQLQLDEGSSHSRTGSGLYPGAPVFARKKTARFLARRGSEEGPGDVPIAFDPATGGYIAVTQQGHGPVAQQHDHHRSLAPPPIKVRRPKTALQKHREALQELVQGSDESGGEQTDGYETPTPTPAADKDQGKAGGLPRTKSQVRRVQRRERRSIKKQYGMFDRQPKHESPQKTAGAADSHLTDGRGEAIFVPPESSVNREGPADAERTLELDQPFEPDDLGTGPRPRGNMYSKEDGPGGFFPIMARTASRGEDYTGGSDGSDGRRRGAAVTAGQVITPPSDHIHQHWQHEAALLAAPAKGAKRVPGSSKGKGGKRGFFDDSPRKRAGQLGTSTTRQPKDSPTKLQSFAGAGTGNNQISKPRLGFVPSIAGAPTGESPVPLGKLGSDDSTQRSTSSGSGSGSGLVETPTSGGIAGAGRRRGKPGGRYGGMAAAYAGQAVPVPAIDLNAVKDAEAGAAAQDRPVNGDSGRKDSYDEEMRAGLSTVREESSGLSFNSPQHAPGFPATGGRWRGKTPRSHGTEQSEHSVSSLRSGSTNHELVADTIDEGLQMGLPPNVQREVSRREGVRSSSQTGASYDAAPDQDTSANQAGEFHRGERSNADETAADASPSAGTSGSNDVVYTIVPPSAGSTDDQDGHY